MLKSILLFVEDINKSLEFYQNIFGLVIKGAYEGNVVLMGGLVLQDISVWKEQTNIRIENGSSSVMLYFEESDFEGIQKNLKNRGVDVMLSDDKNPDGKRFIRFRDPDGHLIEVAEISIC